jgi:hypothetical protein
MSDAGRRGHGAFRFLRRRAQNPRKRNESFAKRNETLRSAGRNPLKSLRAPDHDFAELFIFNDLTAFSLRAISPMPFLDPKGLIDILACARERRHPATLCET